MAQVNVELEGLEEIQAGIKELFEEISTLDKMVNRLWEKRVALNVRINSVQTPPLEEIAGQVAGQLAEQIEGTLGSTQRGEGHGDS